MLERRGFLGGLASLPLIGGGVALIGQPTGVAAAPEHRELLAYAEWLDSERSILMREIFPALGADAARYSPANTGAHTYHHFGGADWRPPAAPPSSRAALVLATVGCDWRRDAL